jgi:porin
LCDISGRTFWTIPMRRPQAGLSAFAMMASLFLAGPVFAQGGADQGRGSDQPELPAGPQSTDQPGDEATSPSAPSIQSSLGPYGDPGGYRAYLQTRGITYSFTYIGETFGVVSGGQRRGGIYEGRLDAQFDADLDKLLGWSGATLHTNFYQIHGHGLSRYYLGNLFVTSGIEALSSTRLYELWLEQKLFDDKVAVRVGQLAADTEFLTSLYGGLFINSTFGWPAITAADLPNGGPAYPFATPAVRVKWQPNDQLTFMGAIFNGDPAGGGPGDPQINNGHGLEFRTRDPAFLIGEAAYTYNQGKDDKGLPGTIKLGGWHHLARFDDQRFAAVTADAPSPLLADPSSSGVARRLRGNDGIYAVIDQLLYREPGTSDQGLGMFARVSASPSDRNLVSFYADGGLTYKGLFPGRRDDTAGISVAYAEISSAARGFDRDTAFFNGGPYNAIRSSEMVIEATYQAQVVPGVTIQPDLQYIIRPGGNQVNPRSPTGAIEKNATVIGLRASIRY